MLDGAGDAGGDEELRPHRLAGLPDLTVVGGPAGLDERAGHPDLGAQDPGEVEDQLHVLDLAQPLAGRHDDVGEGQLRLVLLAAGEPAGICVRGDYAVLQKLVLDTRLEAQEIARALRRVAGDAGAYCFGGGGREAGEFVRDCGARAHVLLHEST